MTQSRLLVAAFGIGLGALATAVLALAVWTLPENIQRRGLEAGKFDSARYSAIDDRLDQQDQSLVTQETATSSPAPSADVNTHSSSQPWL